MSGIDSPRCQSRMRSSGNSRPGAHPLIMFGHGPSGRPTQPAAVLQYLVRPRASLRAGLAELQQRRVPRRRPRPVTHMMPGIRVVLIPVAPFPAAVCPGELRTAERADLRASRSEGSSGRIIGHLRNPLRRCWLCAWPGVVAAAPAAECGRMTSLRPVEGGSSRLGGAPRSVGELLRESRRRPSRASQKASPNGRRRCPLIGVRARGRARPADPSDPA